MEQWSQRVFWDRPCPSCRKRKSKRKTGRRWWGKEREARMWGWGRERRRRRIHVRRGGAGSKSRTGSGTEAVSRRPVQVPLIMQTMRHSPRSGCTLRAARYHYINFSISIQLPVANLSGVMVGLGPEQRWRCAERSEVKQQNGFSGNKLTDIDVPGREGLTAEWCQIWEPQRGRGLRRTQWSWQGTF